jgi:hypothetical protein
MTDPKLTPPPELVQQWIEETRSHDTIGSYPEDLDQRIANRAAQWGSDTELDACCEWLDQKVLLQHQSDVIPELRAARRPKPPTLKEQAFEAQQRLMTGAWRAEDWQLIGRALEALPE